MRKSYDISSDGDSSGTNSGERRHPTSFSFVSNTRHYVVDLDVDARHRWDHIIVDFKEQILEFSKEVAITEVDEYGRFGNMIAGVISTLASYQITEHLFPKYLLEEMEGIAAITQQWDSTLDYRRILLINVAYDLLAACTSTIIDSITDEGILPYHLRAMDWEMDTLRDLTVDVCFVRKGVTIYKATSWVGFVGIMTGLRYAYDIDDGYSVSINYRVTNCSVLWNLLRLLNSTWPLGFLVRHTLETERTYEESVHLFNTKELIAPVYIIVAGRKKGDGISISRGVSSVDGSISLTEGRTWINIRNNIKNNNKIDKKNIEMRQITQCNSDLWVQDTVSDDWLVGNSSIRVGLMSENLREFDWYVISKEKKEGEEEGEDKEDEDKEDESERLIEQAFQALRCYEVCSGATIYHTVMIPSQNHMSSYLVYPNYDTHESDEREIYSS